MLSWVLPGLWVFTTTLFGARIFYFLPFDVVRFSLATQILILAVYLTLALYRLHIGVVVAAVALTVYLLSEHVLFANLARAAPNYNAMASYLPLLSFVVFAESRASFNDLMRIILAVAVGYCFIYVVGHGYLTGVNASSGAMLTATAGRAARLYLLGSWATFVALYGLMLRRLPVAARAALILLACTALYLSGSRTLQAAFLLVFALTALGWTGLRTRSTLFAGTVLLTLVALGGLAVDGWNPYTLFGGDTSAIYRGLGYSRAIEGIERYPLFGIGIPDDMETLAQFLRIPRDELLFPSDLGVTGVALMLGYPGLVLSLATIAYAMFGTGGIGTRAGGQPSDALKLNVILTASILWMSPMLIAEPTAMFLGALIAYTIRTARQRRAEGATTA